MRKATDEQLAESYSRLGNVWKVGEEFGMCGQSVHERLSKLGLINNPKWTESEDRKLKHLYSNFKEQLFLDAVSRDFGRSRAAIACRANELGITKMDRPTSIKTVRKLIEDKGRFARTRNGRGFKTNGGYRDDLEIYVRSTWEANYARYLNFCVERNMISKWEYEPDTFEFYEIKKGNRFYTPDFKVYDKSGNVVYHEVKGYMDATSKTKLSRMKRYYPEIQIKIIDKKIMFDLKKKLSSSIKNWEEAGT